MIWSPACTTCELSSNDRCVVIKSISSFTGSTFDASKKPLPNVAEAVLARVVDRGCSRRIRFLEQVVAQLQQPVRVHELGQLQLAERRQRRRILLAVLNVPVGRHDDARRLRRHGDVRLEQVTVVRRAEHDLPGARSS